VVILALIVRMVVLQIEEEMALILVEVKDMTMHMEVEEIDLSHRKWHMESSPVDKDMSCETREEWAK